MGPRKRRRTGSPDAMGATQPSDEAEAAPRRAAGDIEQEQLLQPRSSSSADGARGSHGASSHAAADDGATASVEVAPAAIRAQLLRRFADSALVSASARSGGPQNASSRGAPVDEGAIASLLLLQRAAGNADAGIAAEGTPQQSGAGPAGARVDDDIEHMFARAVFETGLQAASPAALMRLLVPGESNPHGLTTEHIKSHLQRARINWQRVPGAQREFLDIFDAQLRAPAPQPLPPSDSSVEPAPAPQEPMPAAALREPPPAAADAATRAPGQMAGAPAAGAARDPRPPRDPTQASDG